MRHIALFSDVHGNVPALEAVLADIEDAGLEEVYCLGDLVGYGPDPSGVIQRVRDRGIPTVRGNYDDGIGRSAGECGCYYATPEAKSDGAASYAFTECALDDSDRAWLAALPEQIRLEVDDLRVLLAHGSPRKINEYLLPDRSDEQLIRLAQAAEADVVCIGHIHIPYHRSMQAPDGSRIHYVSTGSAGKPKDGDPRAAWLELVIGSEEEVASTSAGDGAASAAGSSETWVGARVHRVDYDIETVAEAMRAAGLPSRLIDGLRRG